MIILLFLQLLYYCKAFSVDTLSYTTIDEMKLMRFTPYTKPLDPNKRNMIVSVSNHEEREDGGEQVLSFLRSPGKKLCFFVKKCL